MTYKWIISDLDGTIIHHKANENIIYKEVIKSINDFIEIGGLFTIATGRHYKDVISIIKNNNINYKDNFFILGMNGGQIYSWGEKKLIFNGCLPNEKIKHIKEIIDTLYKKYENKLLVFGYGENEKIYIIKNNSENFEKQCNEIIQYEDNDDTFEYIVINLDGLDQIKNINKFCLAFDNCIGDPIKLINELKEISSDVEFIQTGTSFVEIMPANIDKGSSSKYVNDNYYKMPLDKIISFGDSGNDIGLFKFSAKSVTRSCAPEYVKKEATCTYDDGPSMFVKSAIERCILSKEKGEYNE
ncbi:MAG: HAD-IIB family hydrolase [Mycoplasmoidaceae bacterium]